MIDTTVVFLNPLDENDILTNAETNNIITLLNKQNILLSDLEIKVNKARYLPKINGSAGYNWFESINPPTGFAIQNESYGLNLGLNLTWNLFDGGSTSTRIQASKIAKENREIELYRVQEELKLDVYNAYEDYNNKQFTLKAEENNVTTNKLNFNRTQKQFSLGQVSAIEYRQAQINLFNALNNLAKAKYDLKIAEINLQQLAGKLVE
jgi:outer membrane protein TolC